MPGGNQIIITLNNGVQMPALGLQDGLDVFAVTDEAREGAAAFAEKSQPDFTAHQVTR